MFVGLKVVSASETGIANDDPCLSVQD
jgi:hypothetical protein